MKRILRIATAAVALLGAPLAWGIGLGDAAVTSDMSSPLRVTLPVVGVTPGAELDSLRVDIPGELEHEALGFPDPIRPLDLSARLMPSARGGARITVTTRSVVREPVLRFLVRLTWPGGQRLREYELIVDPPAVARPVARRGITAVVRPAPVVTPRGSPRPLLAAPRPVEPPRAGTRYGPVAAGDTLLEIVRTAYPERRREHATAMQTVVDRNPDAFVAGDASRLMMGAFLDLPGAQELADATTVPVSTVPASRAPQPAVASGASTYTVAPGDTLYSIARQVAGSPARVGDVVRQLFENNPQAFAAGDIDRLQAGAVLRLTGAGPVAAAPVPVAPDAVVAAPAPLSGASETLAPEQVAALQSDVATAETRLGEERARQSDLRGRLDALIQTMESLRARDAELTARAEALRSELARKNAEVAAAAASRTALVQPPTEASEPAPAAAPAVPQPALPANTEAASPQAPAVAAPTRTRAPRPQPAQEPGMLDDVMPLVMNPLVWIAAGALLLAILAILALRLLGARGRKAGPAAVRQRADEEATAQKLAEVRERHTASGRFEAEALAAADEAQEKKKASTVHLTDTARAGNLAKEAAVHLAYEDYSAAKACITEAIRLDPHRDEHKMVLVTVYEATGEQETARAIVNDLLSRRDQLPGDLRRQVEQLRQEAAG